MTIYEAVSELKKMFEAGEMVFKPAGEKELGARKEIRRQVRKAEVSQFADSWKVVSITVNHPGSADTADGWHDSSSMWRWWRNNKKWKDSGIRRIDENPWKKIAEFFFDEARSIGDASALVKEFINDWAKKPAVDNKQLEVGDVVYLRTEGSQSYNYADDVGRVKDIPLQLGDGKSQVKVRLQHHGNVMVDKDKLVYDKDGNSWTIMRTPEFREMASQKKGTPAIGDQVYFKRPKGEHNYRYSSVGGESTPGRIDAIENGVATISYRPGKKDYADPEPPPKTVRVNVADLTYSWVNKTWHEKGTDL